MSFGRHQRPRGAKKPRRSLGATAGQFLGEKSRVNPALVIIALDAARMLSSRTHRCFLSICGHRRSPHRLWAVVRHSAGDAQRSGLSIRFVVFCRRPKPRAMGRVVDSLVGWRYRSVHWCGWRRDTGIRALSPDRGCRHPPYTQRARWRPRHKPDTYRASLPDRAAENIPSWHRVFIQNT
jgi:hypothetical protein